MTNRPIYDVVPVPFSGCFIWMGPLNKDGYGNVSGKYAHRIAWEKTVGPIPDKAHVLHHCDVRCCINVAHLFLGDQAENNRDAARKGRTVVEGKRILIKKQREEITQRYLQGNEQEEALAEEFNITAKHVRSLAYRALYSRRS